ncbi:hypothetical protein EDD11_009130 [Mortierella claussenii]|nr:hypothetical protein EDD11_009130 [Mortierella claussenii]
MFERFTSHPIKGSESIREIVLVGSLLNEERYCKLIVLLISEFNKEGILQEDALQALVQLVLDAPPKFLEVKDLVRVLESIRVALKPSAQHVGSDAIYLTQACSKILQVMADLKVKDLNREGLHKPLLDTLSKLKKQKVDPFTQYLARYSLQSLQYVPDDETATQCFFRHFITLAGGAVQISEVRNLDIRGITDGFPAIIEGGKGLFDMLKGALGQKAKRPWYEAIRGAELLVQKGDLADLNKAICESSCLNDR